VRNKSFATLGTLALLAAASAVGQTKLTADVPFEFSFANTVMPAGHYDITHTPVMLEVRGFTSGAGAFSATTNIGDGKYSDQGRLVFHKYGDKYFLTEAWSEQSGGWAVGVPMSKTEREIARSNPDVARVTLPLRIGVVTLASLK
jgi:hypothetical protein